ncbi:hypothetical protein GGF32_008116, partial [Allomyces javanicus]
LHILGYMHSDETKGSYTVGHERPDVVGARAVFVDLMEKLEPFMVTIDGASGDH